MTGTDPGSGEVDPAALDRRLRAVERALTDGEGDAADLPDLVALADRVSALEERVDAVEDRLEEQKAAIQAVRGYVGSVRAVNRDVEERADAALAAVQSVERRLDGHDAPRRPVHHDDGGDGRIDGPPADADEGEWYDAGDGTLTKVYDRRETGEEPPGSRDDDPDGTHDAAGVPDRNGGSDPGTVGDGTGAGGDPAGGDARAGDDSGVDWQDVVSPPADGAAGERGPREPSDDTDPGGTTPVSVDDADRGRTTPVPATGPGSGTSTTADGTGRADAAPPGTDGPGEVDVDRSEWPSFGDRTDDGNRSAGSTRGVESSPGDRGRESGSTGDHGRELGSTGDRGWESGSGGNGVGKSGSTGRSAGPARRGRGGGTRSRGNDDQGGVEGEWTWPPDGRRDVERATPWGAPDPVPPADADREDRDDEGLLARLRSAL